MFLRQIPQSATRQCCCHGSSVAWFSTRRIKKKKSSWSSSATPSPDSSPSISLYDKLFGRRTPTIPKLGPPVPRSPRPDPGKASRPIRRKEGARAENARAEDAREEGARAKGARAKGARAKGARAEEARAEDDRGGGARGEGARADEDREIDVSHVGDELRAWLKNAAVSAAAELALKKPEPEPKLPDAKPVLVLSSMSRSLVASDFYRWAPQGRHVAGWAGGISKVVQALSPVTREPRGQYFLFFDTWDAAYRCRDQFTRAYQLTNKNESPDQPKPSPELGVQTKSESGNGKSTGNKLPLPTTPLELRAEPQIIPTTDFLNLINSEPATSFRGIPTHSSTVPYRLSAHLAHGGSAPRHDLSWSVLVHLTGGKITVDGMIHAIATDGATRNLPWRLIEPRPDLETWPRPVQALRSGSGRVGLAAERQDRFRAQSGLLQYGYTRFVVTFVDAAEGRRFARAWHRREMVDEWTEGVMTVNATAMW